jgi:predicted phage terminase large subunit-like protein
MFRWLFPELIEEPNKRQKWSETEMLVPRKVDNPEATIEAIGVGGAVVSRHYDIVKLDDLCGKESSESGEVMRKTIDWYIYTESLLVHPTVSEIHVIGTRWAYHDVINNILEHEDSVYDKLILSAEQPAPGYRGTSLWPERFPIEVLQNVIRKKMGSWKYSCQYLNNPHDPEASSFDPNWLRFFGIVDQMCVAGNQTSPIPNMRTFLVIDPAISEDDQACNTAFIVTGVDKLNRKWVLDCVLKRCHPSEIIKTGFELYRAWNCEVLGIEVVAFQKALKHFMEKEMEEKGTYVNIRELKPDTTKSKKTRIRRLQPYFERGEIFFKKTQHELISEYEAFPTGFYVDGLDALSYGPELWGQPIDEQSDEAAEEENYWKTHEEGMDPITGY